MTNNKLTHEQQRKYFTFFRSFQEAIEKYSEGDQLALYRGIVNYALNGKEPVFESSMLEVAWLLIRPNLEKGLRSWENGCIGGAPAGNQNARKTTQKQPKNNPKTTQKQQDRKGKDRIGMEKDNKETDAKKDSLPISPDYSNFLTWLENNCPHLLGMQIPNEKEYQKLLELAGSKKRMTDKLLAMENNKKVPKERRSIYKTCMEWLKNDKDKGYGSESITT